LNRRQLFQLAPLILIPEVPDVRRVYSFVGGWRAGYLIDLDAERLIAACDRAIFEMIATGQAIIPRGEWRAIRSDDIMKTRTLRMEWVPL
jgi:hypothetical protein